MKTIVGLGLIAMAMLFSGCVDNRKINKNFQSVLSKIERQNERIEALEKACRQLHEQQLELSNRENETRSMLNNLPPVQPASPAGIPVESSGAAPQSFSQELLTRGDFMVRIDRMKPEKVKEWLGNPDQVKEGKDSQKWTYDSVVLKTRDGGQTNYSAMVVFEGERVSRVVLFNPIQYGSSAGRK